MRTWQVSGTVWRRHAVAAVLACAGLAGPALAAEDAPHTIQPHTIQDPHYGDSLFYF